MPSVQVVDAVDVDWVVRPIAEQHYLPQPLPSKVQFYPLSARYALRKFRLEGKHYGFAFLDAFSGKGIPRRNCSRWRFFNEARAIADVITANVIMDPEMESAFARNVLTSFRQVFGRVWTRNVRRAIST
jgi:hypothetical protein